MRDAIIAAAILAWYAAAGTFARAVLRRVARAVETEAREEA